MRDATGFLLTLLLALLAATGAVARTITVPHGEATNDPRRRYPMVVLAEALAAAGSPHTLERHAIAAPQERNFRMLEAGQLDVMWSMGTNERLSRAIAVPYPIDFGLLGWRVLLAREGESQRFAQVIDRASLAGFVGIQGHDWPDAAILRANSLPIVTGTEYPGLFGMLAGGRADYFPRSVTEADRELRTPLGKGLVRVPGILLHYRAPLIFFVGRDDAALAEAIGRGLERLKAEGRLEELFLEAYGEDVRTVEQDGLRVIELDNPLFNADALGTGAADWWKLPAP